ncbi:MAG: glycogen-binding domain-containing protein [Brevinema sp.]
MKKKILLGLLILFHTFMFSQSQQLRDVQTIDQLLYQNGVFQTPIFLENYLLFYYKGVAKSVIISGEFNDWQDHWVMQETKSNLWTFTITNRIAKGTYKYRLKVDGFWIADPQNPHITYDKAQQKLSVLTLTNDFLPHQKFPMWVSNDIYLFKYINTNARIVNIIGDFNDWNPFSHSMIYKGAGEFVIELELKAKKSYIYSFIQDGIWRFDENNKKQYLNKQNRPVNIFYADTSNSKP